MRLGVRVGSSLAVARRFWPELARHRGRLLLVATSSVLVACLEVFRPWPIQWVFDYALAPAQPTPRPWSFYVWSGALAYLGVVLLEAGAGYVSNLQLAAVGHAVTRGLRFRVFRHLARLSPIFHARNKSGDLLVRLVGDVGMVRTMLVDSTIALATRVLWVGGMVGVMLWLDVRLALLLLATLPMIALVVRVLSRKIHAAVGKQRRKEGVLADFMHEALAATEVVQSLGRSEEVVRRFARSNRTSERAGLKAARLSARLASSVHALLGVGVAVTLLLGSRRVAAGELSPGELLVFLSYVRGLLKPLRSASRSVEKVAKGTACGERLIEVLDQDVAIRNAPGAVSAAARPRELAFEQVWFRYEEERDVLTDFSARFRTGELSCLFGRSGAGKSTLAALAVRLHDPDRGTVRLDGRDLRELDLESLRDRVGLSLQRSVFFGESIRENLLLARPDAGDEELWQACLDAGADGFVRRLPEGLDTLLGSAGVGLSGGEARRLNLARTLLRDAPVLIVDEPFAGLDRAALAHVRDTLRRLAKDHLVIVIAHELEFLELYDRIVFLDRGTAIGSGSHSELEQRLPAYRAVLQAVPQEVS